MSVAKASLRLSGLFEAELLTELILRYWKHPLADDADFRQSLLELAAEALKASVGGEQLIKDLSPEDVNLVAAIWYAEWSQITADGPASDPILVERRKWLDDVQRALPSCFCDPESLG